MSTSIFSKKVCWGILAMTLSICVFMFISSVSVSAHEGDLDADGGHQDSSTGTYHSHPTANDTSASTPATPPPQVPKTEITTQEEITTQGTAEKGQPAGKIADLGPNDHWLIILALSVAAGMSVTMTGVWRNLRKSGIHLE